MKKLLFSLILFTLAFNVNAQDSDKAQKTTDELVALYDLNEEQTKQMLVIQKREVRNLAQVKHLKESDNKKYRHKHRAIRQGTDASIRRILNKDQLVIYQKQRLEWRQKRADRIIELKESGMPLEEIEGILLEEGF